MLKDSILKKIFSLLGLFTLTLGVFLALSQPIQAAVRCEIQYGGREVCVRTGQLQVNKKVCDPKSGVCDITKTGQGTFVDNIPSTRHIFAPGAEVLFKLEIKNVGDANFSKVNVVDTLPTHLRPVDGLTWEITDLAPGETEERFFRAKVAPEAEFGTVNAICELNQAEAKADNGESDRDMAQVCMARKELKVLPKAGAGNSAALTLFMSLIVGTLGIYLVKTGRAEK